MLALTTKDLSCNPAGEAGVRIWWTQRDGVEKPDLLLSFPDLVLIRPKVSWPEHVHPERHAGWGREAMRILWHAGLSKALYSTGVPVLDVHPCLQVQRGVIPRATLTKERWRHKGVVRAWVASAEDGAWLPLRTLTRIRRALERKDPELRVLVPDEGTRMVFVFVNEKLRALATGQPREAAS